MTLSREQANDERLSRYLLGSLPEREAEELDELSVADEEVAARLSAVEHDLVDAYVRGELSGDTLDRFRSRYLSSSTGIRKVGFAEALLAYDARTVGEKRSRDPARVWNVLTRPRFIPNWAMAAAALLVLAVAAGLSIDNLRLRREIAQSVSERGALDVRMQDLQRQMDADRTSSAEAEKELARLRAQATESPSTSGRPAANAVLSFLLLPPRRGPGDLQTITIPRETADVRLQAQLESDDFPAYSAALTDPASGRTLWRRAPAAAQSSAHTRIVTATVPAHLLKAQNYVLEIRGVPRGGSPELIAGYAFRIVLQ